MDRLPNRRGKSLYSIVSLLLVFFFLFYGIALASGGHEGGDLSGDLRDLLFRFINFALLVIILIWAIRKAGVKDFFSARSEKIRQRLNDLKKGKEEAENRYREIERKLIGFEEERKDIIEQFKNEGLAEKEKIIAEAGERVKQIIEQAELTIQREIQSARDRLKQEVVDLAAQKAQEIIAKKLTEEVQDRLVNEFIERVDRIH